MSKWKLNGGGGEGNLVAGAYCFDFLRFPDELGGCLNEVKGRGRLGIVKDPSVVGTADDYGNVLVHAKGQNLVQSALVEQCVSTSDQEAIKRGACSEIDQQLIVLSS